MSAPLTEEYLAEIEALCAAATASVYMAYPTGSGVAWNIAGPKAPTPSSDEFLEADARLMAESRTGFPKLLAEIRRLKAVIAEAGKTAVTEGMLISEVGRVLRSGAGFLED